MKMLVKELPVSLNSNNDSLLVDSISIICRILETEYKMTHQSAYGFVIKSGVYQKFKKNSEVAAHTSYKTWANRVYNFATSSKMKELNARSEV